MRPKRAAQVRGYIGTIDGVRARLEEIDSELYEDGLAHSHHLRTPLIHAILALEEAATALDQSAKVLID